MGASTRRRKIGDYTRRGRWLDSVHKAKLSPGAKAFALCLAARSNSTAKSVYGTQLKQADEIARSDRSVRRYRKELEEAGLITVVRSSPRRDEQGRFSRLFTNIYNFVVAPLKRQNQKTSPYRPDTGVRSNPTLTSSYIKPSGETPEQVNEGRRIVITDPGWEPGDFESSDLFTVATLS